MKLVIRLFLSLLLSVGLQGCDTRDQQGYPDVVQFPQKGGQINIEGHADLKYVSIYNSKGESKDLLPPYSAGESEIFSVTFEWLTVEMQPNSRSITLIAEPNTTNKKRYLRIVNQQGPGYLEIVVKQDK